jgi:hypothetical protein
MHEFLQWKEATVQHSLTLVFLTQLIPSNAQPSDIECVSITDLGDAGA